MKYAKGELKKYSEGTNKSPFIKGKHSTTVKHGATNGGKKVTKKPRIQGQK